jgi:hypothetical protein
MKLSFTLKKKGLIQHYAPLHESMVKSMEDTIIL